MIKVKKLVLTRTQLNVKTQYQRIPESLTKNMTILQKFKNFQKSALIHTFSEICYD